ncbi:hypothetical protein [Mucilaginibacter ginkgonis]|uniref:VWA domain-containing protein n=1 Tax=Mucilaginibacter ginkgonis TaxID=2682091 RepID=A0A6I4I2H8_9SPHI|nr:hypothetical protein [Mucilaginibacter ginkgonis]QQL50510.1 hypothetical protein GO620_003380 [Mucilaginibacter ginkgonis]
MHFLFAISWGSVSGWWVLLCLLAGALYAWLMYRLPVVFNNRLRYALTAFRFLAVTLIALLLLSPIIKSTNYQPQKPLVLVAVDNSASIQKFNPPSVNLKQVVNDMGQLKQALGDKYDVREFHFGKDLQPGLPANFTAKQTDIAGALHQLNDGFANQNIGAIVLATDGLYNEGTDPAYEAKNIKSGIYTIGLGDTTTRRDLFITNVNYNKTALLENDFEVEVSVGAYLGKGETMHLTVAEDGKPVLSKEILVNNNNFQKTVSLKLHADEKGLHKFTFSIAPAKNEASLQNNTETIYVEVIDARQKVLLVYNGPHPDIGTLTHAIEANRNFEVKSVKLADLVAAKTANYNLVILYQITDFNQTLQALTAGTSTWVIGGAQTDPGAFNREQRLLQLIITRVDNQEVFALPQTGFSAFTLSDSTLRKIAQMPPLIAMFGNYNAIGNAAVLFKQKIGSIGTNYPLMVFGDDRGRRTAVLAGEGLWRWHLAEYETFGTHSALEELVSQTVMYLTANASRQRFRAYAAKNIFNEGEHVLLNAELYNEALALTNAPDVKLDLKNSNGKNYSFQFSRNGQSYQLDAGDLPAGDYSYTAATQLGKETFKASGQLSVKAIGLEAKQSRADHNLLYNIAKSSGGQLLQPNEIGKLADLIRKNDNIKTILNEDKHYSEPIDLKWVFAIILLLLSAEWFLRKREGEI